MFGVLAGHLLDEGGFHALEAGELPAGFDHGLDQEVFVIVGWLEGVPVAGLDLVEGCEVFVGENGEMAGQSMSGCIVAGGSFTGGRRRPGAVRGVLLVGVDLG
jgi:hypothetical protein